MNFSSKSAKKFLAAFFILCILLSLDTFSYAISGIDIKPSLTVTHVFDDNITFVKSDKKEDFVTNLSFVLDLRREGKTQSFGLKGTIRQQTFADERDFNNTAQDIIFNYQKEISKYEQVLVRNSFYHADEPRSFDDAFGTTSGRYSFYKNKFDLDYYKTISKQAGLRLNYGNEIYTPSRDDLSDSYLNKLGAQYEYFFSSATMLSLLYDFSTRNFSPGTNSFTNAFTAKLKHYLRKDFNIELAGGLNFIESYNDQEYTKPVFLAVINHEIDENTNTRMSFTKQYETRGHTEDVFDHWQLSFALVRQLISRMTAVVSMFYGEGEYKILDISDVFKGFNIALGYDFREDLKGNIGYTFSQTDSNLDTRDYTRNMIFFGITWKF